MFRKYPEIENTYNRKFIDKFIYLYPQLLKAHYVIYEKLHGSNVQIIVPSNGDFQLGKRHSLIEPNENFYGIWDTIKRYSQPINKISEYVKRCGYSYMNYYCEYFGGDGEREPRIQKGVIYNPLQQIRFFAVAIEDRLQPPIVLEDIFDHLGLKELLVPKIGIIEGLDAALHIDVNMTTLINPYIEDNFLEGVVIQPHTRTFVDKTGKRFLLKKKHPKFEERGKRKKSKPVVNDLDEKIIGRLHEIFLGYLNENRLQGTFSKVGEIQDKSEMSKYIEFTIKDAIKDFEKDFGDEMDEAGYSRLERKRIYKGAGVIVEMLKQYL